MRGCSLCMRVCDEFEGGCVLCGSVAYAYGYVMSFEGGCVLCGGVADA